MARIVFSTLLFLLLTSCISNEVMWEGSLREFTSRYVDELRRMGADNENIKGHESLNQNSLLINHFLIETAAAKTKKSQSKKKKNEKPLILKTAEVRKIQKRQAKRMTTIDRYKVKGHIGEKDTGILGVRSTKGLSKKKIEQLQSLVKAENKDRELLYSIISKASGYNKKMEATLRISFFESYQEWAPSGTYYYKDNKWRKK